MSVSDPIADSLTKIRNATKAHHKIVDVRSSKINKNITQILFEKKYIKDYIFIDDGLQGLIRIYLRYDEDENSVIKGIKRISKPGRRVYAKSDSFPRVRDNLGIVIISTPKGVMTSFDAEKSNVGGEVICYVW